MIDRKIIEGKHNMNRAGRVIEDYNELRQRYKKECLSRRDVLKTGGYVAGFAALVGVFGMPSLASAEISMPEIKRLMNRSTVDDVLQREYDNKLIQKIKYNPSTKKTNFDELVFQKDLSPDKRKPVLVMFYGSPGESDSPFEKREAIVLRELSYQYKGQLFFAAYNIKETKNISEDIKDIWQHIIKKHSVNASPSIAMYSKFELATGETPSENRGMIKQIDILRGGPDADKEINENWLPFLKDKWITTNLTSLNNAYAWRFNNSGKKNRIFYEIRRSRHSI